MENCGSFRDFGYIYIYIWINSQIVDHSLVKIRHGFGPWDLLNVGWFLTHFHWFYNLKA